MLQFSIGVSALQSSQRAMQVIGNNIANANTPGYHRQVVHLANVHPLKLDGLSIGRGVEVASVRRIVNDSLEAELRRQSAVTATAEAMLSGMSKIEDRLATDETSPARRLETLFGQLEQLSSRTNDVSVRRLAISAARRLATELNSASADFSLIRDDVDREIDEVVGEINPLAEQVAKLNVEIARFLSQGVEPNDLLDQRTQRIQELATRTGGIAFPGNQGQITFMVAGAPLVVGANASQLVATRNADGRAVVRVAGTDEDLPIDQGRLGGLLEIRERALPKYQQRLDEFARGLIQAFNEVQSTGVGLAGSFQSLIGQQEARAIDVPLTSAGLSFPPQAGSVFVGMTNLATGERTLSEVAVDPQSQSLTDIAAGFAAVPHLQAFVNSQTGTMSLFAGPGYAFDFRGGVPSSVTSSFAAGTTTAVTLEGGFSAAINDEYRFEFLGSGTIGETPGLQVQLTNRAGEVVGIYDIGSQYRPGQTIPMHDGLTLTLSAGDVVVGDSFTSAVVGQPDSARLLAALGLNAFFQGSDASSIRIAEDLAANPDRLATSRSGLPGDTTNLQSLVGLREAARLSGETETFFNFYNRTLSDSGIDVAGLNEERDTAQLLTNRLEESQQSVSGVDTNEELLNMLRFQRMFQIGARYISTVNEALDELVRIA